MNADLPDDLRAWLHGQLEPDPPAPEVEARIKRRLLRAIAADATSRHLTVPPGDDGWQPFAPGLDLKVLHEAGGIMSYLLRLAPGASIPPHRHPVDEECVVLEGELRIGELVVPTGGFHLARADAMHERIHSERGALIFLRGAAPEFSHLI